MRPHCLQLYEQLEQIKFPLPNTRKFELQPNEVLHFEQLKQSMCHLSSPNSYACPSLIKLLHFLQTSLSLDVSGDEMEGKFSASVGGGGGGGGGSDDDDDE